MPRLAQPGLHRAPAREPVHVAPSRAAGQRRARRDVELRHGAKPRVLAYLRVSTLAQQQDGKNLDGQLDEVRAYCARKGYELRDADVFRDIVSGARTDRVGYYQLLARLEREDAEVIVSWNVSRLGRNSIDGAWLMAKAKEHGCRIETAQEGVDFTADPQSEFMYEILTAVAKLHRNTILQDMARGKKRGHKDGRWVVGSPPWGYTPRGPRGGKVLVPNEDAGVVQEIFRRYDAGESARAIALDLRARGHVPVSGQNAGKPWAPNTVGRVLDSPIYAGFLAYRGEVVKGQHEPIIMQDVWERVRARRATRRKTMSGRPRKETEG